MKNAVIVSRCMGYTDYVKSVRQDRGNYTLTSNPANARRFSLKTAQQIAAELPSKANTSATFTVETRP